jgi:hypothetical protein
VSTVASKIDAVNTVLNMRLKVAMDVFVLGYPKGIDGGGEFPIWREGASQLNRAFIVVAPHTSS